MFRMPRGWEIPKLGLLRYKTYIVRFQERSAPRYRDIKLHRLAMLKRTLVSSSTVLT